MPLHTRTCTRLHMFFLFSSHRARLQPTGLALLSLTLSNICTPLCSGLSGSIPISAGIEYWEPQLIRGSVVFTDLYWLYLAWFIRWLFWLCSRSSSLILLSAKWSLSFPVLFLVPPSGGGMDNGYGLPRTYFGSTWFLGRDSLCGFAT